MDQPAHILGHLNGTVLCVNLQKKTGEDNKTRETTNKKFHDETSLISRKG